MRRAAFSGTICVAVLAFLVALSFGSTTNRVTTTAAPRSTVYVPDDWTNPTPTTVAAEPEPVAEAPPPELCPGAPHPEQACLAPAHNHEATRPSAGTRQASGGTASSGGGCSAPGPTPPDYIKQRESSGDYGLNDPNGHYGAWQFSPETWAGVGGSGNPANASPAEQDCRAAVLWNNGAGASNWAATA